MLPGAVVQRQSEQLAAEEVSHYRRRDRTLSGCRIVLGPIRTESRRTGIYAPRLHTSQIELSDIRGAAVNYRSDLIGMLPAVESVNAVIFIARALYFLNQHSLDLRNICSQIIARQCRSGKTQVHPKLPPGSTAGLAESL